MPAEMKSALSLWEPRRQMTLAQARRRSAFISNLRLVLIAGAAICAGIMLGHLAANAFSRSASGVEKLSSEEVITMVNARFTGRDLAGRSFVITADTAQRQVDDNDKVELLNPRLVNEAGTEIDAPSGLYDQDAQTLTLYEDVQLVDAKGYDFRSTSAKVFIEEGRVDGIEPLTGTGPLGDLTCDTYEIVDEGEKLNCQGNVKMTIFPGGREQSGSAPRPSATEDTNAND